MQLQIIFVLLCLLATALAWECQNGVDYKENDCNECSCTKRGLLCTRMGCSGGRTAQYENCEVGTEWKDDCNDCVCTKEYRAICTSNIC